MEAEVDRVYHKLTVPLSVQQAISHSSTASSTGQPAIGVFPVSRPHSPQAVPNVEAVLNHAATEPVANIPYEEEVDAIAVMQDFIKNIVMKVNERIALDTQAAEPIKDPAQLVEDIPNEVSTATGIVAEAIIGRHRGSAQGPFTMNFSISQHQLDALTLWNERWKHTDIESSLCISLLCFKEADIRARLDPAKKIDFRSLLRDLECCWPKSGDLSASWNGQPTQLPIAPPLAYRSDEPAIVDISPFVSLGPNKLTFAQNTDLTSYCFVLCAHNPSPAQLRAVQRRRYKEQSWMAWLQKQTKPLPLPFKLPIPMDS
ncbi:hypothetical protein C8F01DRAFT_20521 [Mycena amicta]|nr:hypothetical protein C8F01DRAFT_20521 [Mycena amicta]